MNSSTIIIDKLLKNQEFMVGDSETKTFVIFLADKKNQIGKLKVIIKGNKSNVAILGIIVGSGKQKIDLYTLQDHLKPESISDLFIKSVLFDEAKFNYQGLIKIEKGAQKSNAYQKNQNLLMSPHAWADSRPYLEILANDVRCTHGATVGKIDRDQLYYLQTRGLSTKEATQLIIEGYCNEVLERIPNDKIRDEINKKLNATLQGLTLRS